MTPVTVVEVEGEHSKQDDGDYKYHKDNPESNQDVSKARFPHFQKLSKASITRILITTRHLERQIMANRLFAHAGLDRHKAVG